MIIKSDNNDVEKSLRGLVKLLQKNGAWFAPNLTMRCNGGFVSMLTDGPAQQGSVLIKMPAELLVP